MFLAGKSCFAILGLFGGVGLCFLPSFLEDDTNFSEVVRKRILIAARVLFCVALVYAWVFLDPGRITKEKMAYQTQSFDEQVKIEVVDILKEKKKATVYVISCGYGNFEIPEDVYQDYIGDEYNIVTVHLETATMYVSNSVFDHKFDSSTSYTIKRLSFPWEDTAKAFSKDEISVFQNLLIDKKIFLQKSDFPFEIDSFLIGSCHRNCLELGALRVADD